MNSPHLIRSSMVCVLFGLFVLFGAAVREPAAQESFEAVVAGLRDLDPAVRFRAITLLKESGYPEAAVPIAALLNDPDDRVQLEAIDAERSLAMIAPIVRKRRVGLVLEVRTGNVGEQAFAAGPLALLPRRVEDEVVSGLVAAMRDANALVRIEALYAFGMLAPLAGPPSQSAPIREGIGWTVEALRRGERDVQLGAIEVGVRVLRGCGGSLPADGDPASACTVMGSVLIDAINTREPTVRRSAMRAVGKLNYLPGWKALTEQFAHYREGPDAEAALEGLAGFGRDAGLFRSQLASRNASLRRFAVEGLARSEDGGALAELDTLAQTERSDAVLLALHFASLKLGAQRTPDQLVAALRNAGRRPQAESYLLELGATVGPAMVGFLQSPDPDTRAMVADVLGFSGDLRVAPALEAATRDGNAEVSGAADRALARLRLMSQPRP